MVRHHPSASVRRREALRWVQQLPPGSEGVIIAPSLGAANGLLRDALEGRDAAFGWHRTTLAQLAGQLALPRLAAQGRAPASPLAMEALAARVVFELGQAGRLGRFQPVAHRPGLPRALVRTLRELELAEVALSELPDDVAELRVVAHALKTACVQQGVATRAELLRAACARAQSDAPPAPGAAGAAGDPDAAPARGAPGGHPLLGLPVLSVDVPLRSPLEARLLAALLGRHPASLCVLPSRDTATLRWLRHVGLSEARPLHAQRAPTALTRLEQHLFASSDEQPVGAASGAPASDASVRLLSAPGESRECVELARHALDYARAGVPFERMAVLLRSPESYRAHLHEAFARAGIPAHFTEGARRPEPAGRALLALLDCAAEGLSARALGEYLSLGVLPRSEDGAPPPAASPDETFAPPHEDYWPSALLRAREEYGAAGPGEEDEDELAELAELADPAGPQSPADAQGGAAARDTPRHGARRLRAPRTWEALLIESRAVGGRERWSTRLAGLRAELELRAAEVAAESPESPRARSLAHRLASLAELSAFILPLLDELDALPTSATWGRWVAALSRVATRALREPLPVLRALAELEPMGDVGPVTLTEVRLVLGERLGELRDAPSTQLAGKVFVGSPDDARGHSFDVVFIPGLAEKLFPKKVLEDPILRDAARVAISPALHTSAERVAQERLALHLAVGAAERAVVLSWPRVDTERGRPRVPSFYGLEVIRAAEGTLPDFQALEARASHGAASRLGWPAPEEPSEAIDDAEFDLATLARALRHPEDASGAARYLLTANAHLARALRARARRHGVARFVPEDGLVQPSERAARALAKHRLGARAYSATALERYARCPYQFYLHSVVRLSPREVPERVEGLDPLTRGSFIHEAQFRALRALRAAGGLPIVGEAGLARARAEVTRCFAEVEREYRERLAPAIEDVFRSHVEAIHMDLLEWVSRLADTQPDAPFVPTHFELAFGLPTREGHDEASRPEPLSLSNGLTLRGSIDLVERRSGTLRATDYKTGRNRSAPRLRVGGGQTLQPALYALALEALFPQAEVSAGRLYFCTSRGEFASREVPLDDVTRAAVQDVLAAIEGALEDGFLPPVPEASRTHSACERCDYVAVCGSGEGRRVARKVRHAQARAGGAGEGSEYGRRLLQLELLRRRE